MAERLKDMFFTASSVGAMSHVLKKHYSAFDKERFTALVFDAEFGKKELKARMRHTTECLHKVLPASYPEALSILRKAAPEVKGFEAMCLPDYVELYGLNNWDLSLDALEYLTKYASSEWAIRPFITKDPKRAMAFMEMLADHEDPKVRRFASEGCRPRLPWAPPIPGLKKDPGLILPILEKLKDDESEFVRKSVANNLNDISKDHPELVLNICERWQGKSKNTDWIIKRACRTMLKAGLTPAMLLFGFGDPELIDVKNLKLDKKKPAIGDSVRIAFVLDVRTKKKTKVRLEYAVFYAKAKGKVSKKVFQISENAYKPGKHEVTKKHSFADMSTRKHYPGEHRIGIIVNGVEKAGISMVLTE
jgi:3-methyladenine DNA glycosylase AlkC